MLLFMILLMVAATTNLTNAVTLFSTSPSMSHPLFENPISGSLLQPTFSKTSSHRFCCKTCPHCSNTVVHHCIHHSTHCPHCATQMGACFATEKWRKSQSLSIVLKVQPTGMLPLPTKQYTSQKVIQ